MYRRCTSLLIRSSSAARAATFSSLVPGPCIISVSYLMSKHTSRGWIRGSTRGITLCTGVLGAPSLTATLPGARAATAACEHDVSCMSLSSASAMGLHGAANISSSSRSTSCFVSTVHWLTKTDSEHFGLVCRALAAGVNSRFPIAATPGLTAGQTASTET